VWHFELGLWSLGRGATYLEEPGRRWLFLGRQKKWGRRKFLCFLGLQCSPLSLALLDSFREDCCLLFCHWYITVVLQEFELLNQQAFVLNSNGNWSWMNNFQYFLWTLQVMQNHCESKLSYEFRRMFHKEWKFDHCFQHYIGRTFSQSTLLLFQIYRYSYLHLLYSQYAQLVLIYGWVSRTLSW